MPLWLPMYLVWGEIYASYREGKFSENFNHKQKPFFLTAKFCKIGHKYNRILTGSSDPPHKLHRQPIWHMKDNEHSYLLDEKC